MALQITTLISIYGLNPAQIESLQGLGLDLKICQGRNRCSELSVQTMERDKEG